MNSRNVILEKVADLLLRNGDIDLEAIEMIFQRMERNTIDNRSHFVHQGQTAKKLYFVEDKFVRFYRITSDGDEITTNICTGPAFFTSVQSFFTQSPSNIFIQAMSKTEYYSLEYDEYIELCVKINDLIRISERLINEVYEKISDRLHMLLFPNPLQRYQWLQTNYSDLVGNVPLHCRASLIGIKTETLSWLENR